MLGRILLGAFYGIIAVLAWDIALSVPWFTGWIYAVSAAVIISLAIYFITIAVISRGNIAEREAYFVANQQMLFLFLGSILIALIVGLIRLAIHYV